MGKVGASATTMQLAPPVPYPTTRELAGQTAAEQPEDVPVVAEPEEVPVVAEPEVVPVGAPDGVPALAPEVGSCVCPVWPSQFEAPRPAVRPSEPRRTRMDFGEVCISVDGTQNPCRLTAPALGC
jgi:hypothetical protein